MIRPPFPARVAAGVIVTLLEETQKLPERALTFPMTAISQTLAGAMRFQQQVAEMAIKGDEVFDHLFSRAEEQPEWAVFDEDDSTESAEPGSASPTVQADEPIGEQPPLPPTAQAPSADAAPTGSGRFALYSSPPVDESATASAAKKPAKKASSAKATASKAARSVAAPEIAEYLEYDALTLAQLRAKLRSVEVDDLQTLVDYERESRSRAPFLTLLENRITAAQK